jgi:ribonuclease P protein component
MDDHTLHRSERLKSEKSISELFVAGRTLSVMPIRLIYILKSSTDKTPFKIGFAVPKKNFKKAVDRNLLKRRMREAYRLNKHILPQEKSIDLPCLEIMLIYQGQKSENFDIIANSIEELLKKLSVKIL